MKPYVICHMCTTIDGRILGDRWPKLPGGTDSSTLFEGTADKFGIGAWLVGTTTMRDFAGRNVRLKTARRRVERTDHVADRARGVAVGEVHGVGANEERPCDGEAHRVQLRHPGESPQAGPAFLVAIDD